jgi:SAM-dependent methyltransferase
MADMIPSLTPMASLRFDLVERLIADVASRSILEIGCGQGAVGVRLAAQADYVGVEPDEQSFAVARERIAAGKVIMGDHTCVPAGSLYDVVCAFEVLEHIEHDADALADWIRFVRPGGHIVLSVPAWPSRFSPMDTLVGHFRRYSPDDMRDLLYRTGLVDGRVLLYGWPLGYALEFTRQRISRRKADRSTETTVADRTAGSGRLLQPSAFLGPALRVGTLPFRRLQRFAPHHGTGIVAVATRPR